MEWWETDGGDLAASVFNWEEPHLAARPTLSEVEQTSRQCEPGNGGPQRTVIDVLNPEFGGWKD